MFERDSFIGLGWVMGDGYGGCVGFSSGRDEWVGRWVGKVCVG
jgi:hypothetical protein